eukprot:3758485-Amphidinium_carterae.1
MIASAGHAEKGARCQFSNAVTCEELGACGAQQIYEGLCLLRAKSNPKYTKKFCSVTFILGSWRGSFEQNPSQPRRTAQRVLAQHYFLVCICVQLNWP